MIERKSQAGDATDPGTLAVTWLGHATALLELDGMRLITDPLLRDRVGPLVRLVAPLRIDEPADLVLLSHLHADHADVPSLRRLGAATPVVAPRGAGNWLRSRGISNVIELSAGERATVGALEVTATAAVHDPRRRPFGARATPIGFVVRGSRAFYFAGDTDLFEAMGDFEVALDLALLPVWGWGPALGPGHLDPERAASAAGLISPRVAIPIHWGTYALARPAPRDSDPARPARRFAALVAERVPSVETRILDPGERTEIAE